MPKQESAVPPAPGGIVSGNSTPPGKNGWDGVLERLLALKPCRFAVLMVLAGLTFLIWAPQGEDVMRALAEQQTGNRDQWQRIFFFAAALAWSFYAWYWARVMVSLKFPGVPGYEAHLQTFRTWAPRVIGFVAMLGVAAALYLASRGYDPDEHPEVKRSLVVYAVWCLIGAMAFLAAVSARRPLSRFAHRKLKERPILQGRIGAPVANMLDVRSEAAEAYGTLGLKDLDGFMWLCFWVAVVMAVVLLLMFVFALQAVAPVIGSAAILLLAAAGWIAVGSVLDFIGMQKRFPVFLTLLALAILFSPLNDNHAVRTLDERQIPAEKREDLRAALRNWMDRQPYRPADAKDSYPMYVVNAEGGGIRAAYWSAMVLGRIQDRNPCFAEQLFSLSGVSGGSLGASVFVALLLEHRAAGGARSCRDAASPGPFSIQSKAEEILGEDFLSPVVAAMLYPDLLQRLLPFQVPAFDRAVAIEQAWERAWALHAPHAAAGANRLAQSLDRLYEDKGRWTPALFLNATWVETGKRLITSNVRIVAPDAAESADFVDAEDAQRFFAPGSIALSSAAHMSARFTYVSPAGTLRKAGEVHGRVVDGGYFENSGATTTLEILKTIPSLAKEDRRWAKVEPIVIHISNEPLDPYAGPGTLMAAPGNRGIKPHRWLNEVLSPLWAMLNARGARGAYARDTLNWHVGDSSFLHFGLCRLSANIPLGWVLSLSTRDRMENQLDPQESLPGQDQPECDFDNAGNLEKVDRRLSSLKPRAGLPLSRALHDRGEGGVDFRARRRGRL